MSNRKPINKTYLYDGSFDGFLTIVFHSYANKILPQKIFPEANYSPNFLDETILIETDFEKAKRVFAGIEKNIGYTALYNTYYAFLSNEKEKEMALLQYLWDGFDIGPKINNRLTLPYVFQVMRMKKRSFGECHRLKGLLRFQEVGNNLYHSCELAEIIERNGYVCEPKLEEQQTQSIDQSQINQVFENYFQKQNGISYSDIATKEKPQSDFEM